MANNFSDRFHKELAESFGKEIKRQYHLSSMEDELAKEWIIELQDTIKTLREENGRILRAAGNSSFNPLIY
jgi:ABC-type Zn uptake system ZnuABC Zn-binding protein ZnuA